MKHDDTTLQAAIDAAMNGRAFIACPEIHPKGWTNESPARLALAKAFLAKLPEQPSSPSGAYTDEEISAAWRSTNLDHPNLNPFSSGWIRAFLAKLPEVQPILADDDRSLEPVAHKDYLDAGGVGLVEKWQAAAQDVASVVLAQAIQRMEAVPVEELMSSLYEIETSQDEAEQIRALLIAAARGEAEQQPDSIDWKAKYEKAEAQVADMRESLESKDRVHKQDTEHLESRLYKAESELAAIKSSPIGILRPLSEAGPVPGGCVRVKGYKCTENDWCLAHWENRHDTHFADIRIPSTETPAQIVNEASDPYARLKAYTKAGARIRCRTNFGTSDWVQDNKWPWKLPPENYEVHPDDLHLVPEYAPANEQPKQQVPLGLEEKLQAIKDILEIK